MHDSATTWRELADQLRPEQIAELDGWERGGYAAASVLFTARVWAAENMSDAAMFGHIAPPPDAAKCYGWQPGDGELWSRAWEGPQHRVAAVTFYVSGRQFGDGNCERGEIIVEVTGTPRALTPAQARELADDLLAAAGEIDGST
jgi:hypothetical protein